MHDRKRGTLIGLAVGVRLPLSTGRQRLAHQSGEFV